MHLFPNTRIFVSFGSLEIAWYAVLILTGALCAYLLCQRTMKKWGYAPEVLDDYVVPMLFIGILGARAWYVIFEWNYYSSHLKPMVALYLRVSLRIIQRLLKIKCLLMEPIVCLLSYLKVYVIY